MNTIRQGLKSQALFLSDFINKDILELQSAKEGSSQAGITQQEKVERMKNFKNCVFVSAFMQVYSIRVANMVSMVTLT